MDLLNHPVGIASLILFVIAYAFVMTEEVTHLRKSKPVLLAAGLIWAMIAGVGAKYGHSEHVEEAIMHAFSEFSQLMLFLLVAMTFINSMTERNVFEKLRSRLLAQDYYYKK
ncbi:MAG: sodium:proton antiporter NhaD [Gammaproteobacteria bacterium]|nr:sodium:proton antiporter NhaD [Gammaproteobacteria bacterium]